MVLNASLRTVAAASALALAVQAQTLTDRDADPAERILSKHGVDIDGRVNSEYFRSNVDGSAKRDTNYAFETSQFTFFDMNMQWRAYDWITAKADLRFYQDWQTFFATRSRILAARWLSVDGNIANALAFNVGDFRQKYSPLTLWAPELDMTYEPLLFSRMRKDLMKQQYLGDNDRLLQGVNLNFARRFDGIVNEVRVDGIGSRVRRGEYLDKTGYQGFNFAKSDMDRFLAGLNAEAFVKNNVYLGGSYLALLDDRDSYRQAVFSKDILEAKSAPEGFSLNEEDSVIARDLRIVSGRAGADLAGFLGNRNLVLEFTAEAAQSRESNSYAWHFKGDTTGGFHYVSTEAPVAGKDGKALLVEMEAGWRAPDTAFALNLSAAFVQNDDAFSNPLAQSPTYQAARIMNTENDLGDGTLQSSFDALYNGVYKFSPSGKVVNGNTAYHHAPISKTSYNNGVMSPEDLKRFAPDPLLQLALPFGYATPNRTGPIARFTASWKNTVHATVDAAMLKEIEGSLHGGAVMPLASLTRTGGGLMVEAGKWFGLARPLDFQASFTRNESKRDRASQDLADPNVSADLIMAGARWRFLKKWGLLAGIQQAKISKTTLVNEVGGADNKSHVYQYRQDDTQNHFRAGLEYSLTRNAYVMVSGGLISVDRGLANMGTTANAEGPVAAKNSQNEFTQTLSQAVIKVDF